MDTFESAPIGKFTCRINQISRRDIKFVQEELGCTYTKAKKSIFRYDGDPVEAVVNLQTKKVDNGRIDIVMNKAKCSYDLAKIVLEYFYGDTCTAITYLFELNIDLIVKETGEQREKVKDVLHKYNGDMLDTLMYLKN
jgi:NACalpha-BTF3-like transcription factor